MSRPPLGEGAGLEPRECRQVVVSTRVGQGACRHTWPLGRQGGAPVDSPDVYKPCVLKATVDISSWLKTTPQPPPVSSKACLLRRQSGSSSMVVCPRRLLWQVLRLWGVGPGGGRRRRLRVGVGGWVGARGDSGAIAHHSSFEHSVSRVNVPIAWWAPCWSMVLCSAWPARRLAGLLKPPER